MKQFIGQKCRFHFRKDSQSSTGHNTEIISITSVLKDVKNNMFITDDYMLPIVSISYVEKVS